MKKFVNKRYAKGKEYKKIISSIEQVGKCPFCPDNFRYHKKPILKREKKWLITKNSWPYKNTKYHFVIIGKKHTVNFNELSKNDFNSVKILVNWALKKFNIKGGALSIRFGDTDHTGATVSHLHFHLISPKLDRAKKARTVYFPIG